MKLQKKAIRILTVNKYNAHTEPLFKLLNMLKCKDLFLLCQLKFYHKFINDRLPLYFQQLPLIRNREVHDHYTRGQNDIQANRVNHEFAKKCIRYHLSIVLSQISNDIKEKMYTHSLRGFIIYAKLKIIQTYIDKCVLHNCYTCKSIE